MGAGEWMKKMFSLLKQDADGDFIMDEATFDVEAFKALMHTPPVGPVSYIVHEQVARYGEFGVYHVSVLMPDGQVVESPSYQLYLGEIPVPATVPVSDSIDGAIGLALYVGNVARDHTTRADVIATLEQRQTRRTRYAAKRRSQGLFENAQIKQAIEFQEVKTARVQAALNRLKQEM